MRTKRALRLDGRRFPMAALITLLPALIIGILAMHIWIGGHETVAGHATGGHSTAIELAGAAPAAGDHGMSPAVHHLSLDAAAPNPGQGFESPCTHGCGSMDAAMATCTLALLLLILPLLVPPTADPLRRHFALWPKPPVMARTSATARAPSLAQLSISRT